MATLLQNGLPASYVTDAVEGPPVIKRVVSDDGSPFEKKGRRHEKCVGLLGSIGKMHVSAVEAAFFEAQKFTI